tara:strand:- start:106 stop:390 length:285 start_codon:yes stop_codon:yes gene_type:complete
MPIPSLDCKAEAKKLTHEFWVKYKRAGSRRQYVFGQSVPSKSDVRRDFMSNMKGLAEIAIMEGDQAALDYIKGIVADDDGSKDQQSIGKMSIDK